MTAEEPQVNYVAMNSVEMLRAIQDDGYLWAKAFKQHLDKHHPEAWRVDEGWLVSWFCNAIEYSSDVRRWRREAAERQTTPCVTADEMKKPATDEAAGKSGE